MDFLGPYRLPWIKAKLSTLWIMPHIFLFAKSTQGVDPHFVTIRITPKHGCLGLFIRDDGSYCSGPRTIRQVQEGFSNGDQGWTSS
jgi:hypothetical protein